MCHNQFPPGKSPDLAVFPEFTLTCRPSQSICDIEIVGKRRPKSTDYVPDDQEQPSRPPSVGNRTSTLLHHNDSNTAVPQPTIARSSYRGCCFVKFRAPSILQLKFSAKGQALAPHDSHDMIKRRSHVKLHFQVNYF